MKASSLLSKGSQKISLHVTVRIVKRMQADPHKWLSFLTFYLLRVLTIIQSAKFPKEAVKIEQGEEYISDWLVPTTISGFEKHKIFCKRCGCTLWTIPMAHGGSHYIVRTALLEGG